MTREQGTGNREQGTGNREGILVTFHYLCRFFPFTYLVIGNGAKTNQTIRI
ncbi:MAG: hypothetical protein ACK57R_16865 [Dolichospermum sp.]|nr:hypothetical protein [Anabaena sp. 49628_E55]